jgi:hypothetical protein
VREPLKGRGIDERADARRERDTEAFGNADERSAAVKGSDLRDVAVRMLHHALVAGKIKLTLSGMI